MDNSGTRDKAKSEAGTGRCGQAEQKFGPILGVLAALKKKHLAAPHK
jgi:hypothetical protein